MPFVRAVAVQKLSLPNNGIRRVIVTVKIVGVGRGGAVAKEKIRAVPSSLQGSRLAVIAGTQRTDRPGGILACRSARRIVRGAKVLGARTPVIVSASRILDVVIGIVKLITLKTGVLASTQTAPRARAKQKFLPVRHKTARSCRPREKKRSAEDTKKTPRSPASKAQASCRP